MTNIISLTDEIESIVANRVIDTFLASGHSVALINEDTPVTDRYLLQPTKDRAAIDENLMSMGYENWAAVDTNGKELGWVFFSFFGGNGADCIANWSLPPVVDASMQAVLNWCDETDFEQLAA